jgi:hypothetical protein
MTNSAWAGLKSRAAAPSLATRIAVSAPSAVPLKASATVDPSTVVIMGIGKEVY